MRGCSGMSVCTGLVRIYGAVGYAVLWSIY